MSPMLDFSAFYGTPYVEEAPIIPVEDEDDKEKTPQAEDHQQPSAFEKPANREFIIYDIPTTVPTGGQRDRS